MAKKIGIFIGSLRKESFSRKLAYNLMEMLPDDFTPEIIEIGDLPLYNQDFDDEQNVPESYISYREKVANLDAALFVTPEYNRSVPAVLKNAIDVGSRPMNKNNWSKLPSAIVSCSPGNISGFGAAQHLRLSLSCVNVPLLNYPEVFIGGIHNLLDKEGKLNNEGTIKFLNGFINSFIRHIDLYSK